MIPDRDIDALVRVIEHDRSAFFEYLAHSEAELQAQREQIARASVSQDEMDIATVAAQEASSEVERLRSALSECRGSWSYRLGNALLHPWRKLRDALRLMYSSP